MSENLNETIDKKKKELMNAYLNKLQTLVSELNKTTDEIKEIVFEVDTSALDLSLYEYIKTTESDEDLSEAEVLEKYGEQARNIVHEITNIVHEFVGKFLDDLIYYDTIVLVEEPVKIVLSLL